MQKRESNHDAAEHGRAGQPARDEAREPTEFKVTDRRHWITGEEQSEEEPQPAARPTVIDEYRERAEAAEQKLQDYIEAFKQFRSEQEEFRLRLNRDVDRKVELKFGELVRELLEAVDNLDLALEHAAGVAEAEPLSRGVALARGSFLAALERHGVEKIAPQHGGPFDPNEAEAVRVDPVDTDERNGSVTALLRPGYRLGDCLIRPAQVAVGRVVGGRPRPA